MSPLDIAILKHLEYLNKVEDRPASFKDFNDQNFKVDGKIYKISYGTFRNKISRLIRKGLVELYYNSKVAFYVLKGIRFGKHNKDPVTAKDTGVYYCHSCHFCHYDDSNHDDCRVSRLQKLIQELPVADRGLHEIT